MAVSVIVSSQSYVLAHPLAGAENFWLVMLSSRDLYKIETNKRTPKTFRIEAPACLSVVQFRVCGFGYVVWRCGVQG